jgi:hypothetical protein
MINDKEGSRKPQISSDGSIRETFEKCSILFKFKSKIPDFERGKARILTAGIHLSISRIRI